MLSFSIILAERSCRRENHMAPRVGWLLCCFEDERSCLDTCINGLVLPHWTQWNRRAVYPSVRVA